MEPESKFQHYLRRVFNGIADIWPLLLFLLLLVVALSPNQAQAADNDKIVVRKETVMRMQQIMAEQQQQQTAVAQDEMAYWFEEYRNQKDCVRASKTHAEALACIGDTEL